MAEARLLPNRVPLCRQHHLHAVAEAKKPGKMVVSKEKRANYVSKFELAHF